MILYLNYSLISNSKEIQTLPLDEKIRKQKYESELINLINGNYLILITASPYRRSHKILRDIKEKTGFEPDESYWNFNRQPPVVKKYWWKMKFYHNRAIIQSSIWQLSQIQKQERCMLSLILSKTEK